jgi:hypothetical protein
MKVARGTVVVTAIRRRGLISNRQLYTVVMPTILVVAAVTAYYIGTEGAFAIAAACTSAVGVVTFADLCFGKTRVNCGKLFGTGILLAYGLTSFNTWQSVQPGLAAFVGVDQGPLCEAIAAVAVAGAVLLAIGESMLPTIRVNIEEAAQAQSASWLVVTSFCIVMVAFAKGSLGYMGLQADSSGTISVLGWMGGWLLPPLFGMTLAVALFEDDRLLRVFFYALLATEGVLTLPLGRRVFIYTLFVGGIVLRFCPSRTPSPLKRGVIAVAAIACMYVASIAFLYIRFAVNNQSEIDEFTQLPLSQEVEKAYELSQVQSYAEVSEALKDNALQRGFILDFVGELLEGTERYGTANGQDIANAIIAEVPSSIWKDKKYELPQGEEGLAGKIFYRQFPDSATSTVTGGALDFGFAGAVLYPLAAAILMTVFLKGVEQIVSPVVGTVITLGALYMMLNTQSGAGEVFAFIRNSTLFGLVLHVIGQVRPDIRKRVGVGLN